jgi:hypothetical protein
MAHRRSSRRPAQAVIRQGRDVGAFFLDESACAVTTAQRAPGGEDEVVMGRAADEVAIGLLGDTMLGRGVGWELQFREAAELWDPELRAP